MIMVNFKFDLQQKKIVFRICLRNWLRRWRISWNNRKIKAKILASITQVWLLASLWLFLPNKCKWKQNLVKVCWKLNPPVKDLFIMLIFSSNRSSSFLEFATEIKAGMQVEMQAENLLLAILIKEYGKEVQCQD